MKYRIHIIAVLVVIISLLCLSASYAEDKEDDKKITIEKTEVLGVLEKPAVIFPVRWKLPEGLPARPIAPRRSFMEEILEHVDRKTIMQEGKWE